MSKSHGVGIAHNIHIGSRKRDRFKHKDVRSLLEANEMEKVVIVDNCNKKTLKMGLHHGAVLHIVSNKPQETNLVISFGDSRIVLSKKIAEFIYIK